MLDVSIDTTKVRGSQDIGNDKRLSAALRAVALAALDAASVPDGRVEVSVAVGPPEAGWLVVRVAPYKQVG